jgi:hypothetical protein
MVGWLADCDILLEGRLNAKIWDVVVEVVCFQALVRAVNAGEMGLVLTIEGWP